MKVRTAFTRSGRKVVLNVTTETVDGWTSYVLHENGFAVSVFVPK